MCHPEPESLQRFFGLRLRLREMTALAADKMVWVGDGSMDGKKIGVRDTFTRKGADLQHLGELQLDGKWVVVQDEVCKLSTAKK